MKRDMHIEHPRRRVLIPSGECPVKLKIADLEAVTDWVQDVRDWGLTQGMELTNTALRYWIGHSFKPHTRKYALAVACIEPDQIRRVLKVAEPTPAEKPDKPPAKAKPKTRVKLFGSAVTSVIRSMGTKKRWMASKKPTDEEVQTVQNVIESLTAPINEGVGIRPDESTVRIQLVAGRKGKRGEPAKLTKSQWSELKEAAQ